MNKLAKIFFDNTGKFGALVKKNSPEIMMIVGAAGTVTAAVMACKATLRANNLLADAKEAIADCKGDLEVAEDDEYTEEECKKDVQHICVKTTLEVVKLYGPSVALGILSMGTMFASNETLRKRNVSLTAAYAAVDTAFKNYRKNVVDEYGEEIDKNLYYGIKKKKVDVIETAEDGTTKTVKKEVPVATGVTCSPYAKFFDESSREWEKDAEYNKAFLLRQQEYADDKLKARGYLFLNEVYEMLGLDISRAGQTVGWIYDKENPIGDNYVDFGIVDLYDEKKRDFINGYERNILLDFNVDGAIIDKI